MRKTNRKKTPEIIKKELQESILEASEEENAKLNEDIKNVKSLSEGISRVQKYENLLKGTNKKIINIVGKQGELLKRFKGEDKFFKCVGLSRSNIYFKFPVLKNSTLTPSFFKSNMKLIKRYVKQTRTYLVNKHLFHYLLSFIYFFICWDNFIQCR